MYSSMNFDRYILSLYHHHNQGIEYSHGPRKFSCFINCSTSCPEKYSWFPSCLVTLSQRGQTPKSKHCMISFIYITYIMYNIQILHSSVFFPHIYNFRNHDGFYSWGYEMRLMTEMGPEWSRWDTGNDIFLWYEWRLYRYIWYVKIYWLLGIWLFKIFCIYVIQCIKSIPLSKKKK